MLTKIFKRKTIPFNGVIASLAVDTGSGRYRYILVRSGICLDRPIELIYSDDDMQTWNLVELGKKGQYIPTQFCLIEFNSRLYLAASNGFIFISEDTGTNFFVAEAGMITREDYDYISAFGNNLLALSSSCAAVSWDAGKTWTGLFSRHKPKGLIQQSTTPDFGGIFPNFYRRSQKH